MLYFIRVALGAVLLITGTSGLLYLALAPEGAAQLRVAQLSAATGQISHAVLPRSPQSLSASQASEVVTLENTGAPALDIETTSTAAPVTHVHIPSISLAAEVVPARLVRVGAAQTWEVPAFKAGHAEHTAGAGEAGNTVLLGHVSSIDAGNVFKELGRVAPGDLVLLKSGDQSFPYRVTEVLRVARDDTSVIGPSDVPTATLITCTGAWLPEARDYSHRLVIRASLVPAA